METELGELRDQMDSQARQIQEQNDLLKAEQEKMQALEEQLKAANSGAAALTSSPATATAAGSSSNVALASAASSSPSVPAASTSQPAPAAPQRGAADTTPGPLSFRIGGADFTPGGFIDVMNVFRTTDNGGSIGTSFGGVDYPIASNYPLAGSTEDRFSLQNSRISLRVDSAFGGGKAVGYLEADFLGNNATNIYVYNNASVLRMRLYFFDYTRGKFEFLGGQDWSMLTSNRNGIGFMPSDIFYTNDVDTNYQLGLVWQRTAQVRFLFHATKSIVAGVSLENPEQYIGSGLITTPTFNSSNGSFINQFDTNSGSGGTTNTPNVLPDIVAKIAFDPMFGKLHEHVEVAGIARTFRAVSYAVGPPPSTSSDKTEGGGVALNSNLEVFRNFHIVENAFWSDGDGRDIIGLVPDVVIRPVNSSGAYKISPVHAGSFIAGFEYQVTPKFQFYGYTSGVYVAPNYVVSGGGAGATCFTGGATCVGYGAPNTASTASPGNAEAQNRYMQEHTLGFNETVWRNPQFGAVNFMLQASYVGRQPWWVPAGTPANAHLAMAYVDLRYTLP